MRVSCVHRWNEHLHFRFNDFVLFNEGTEMSQMNFASLTHKKAPFTSPAVESTRVCIIIAGKTAIWYGIFFEQIFTTSIKISATIHF